MMSLGSCMARTDNHRNSGNRKVNMKIWGGVPSFSRNLSRHQLSCLLALWLLSSTTRRRKRTPWQKLNFVIIWPKSGNLMKYLVHRLHVLCCQIIKSQIDLKLKARSEFPNVWGEYKNHSNPYIQGTTVPCDTSKFNWHPGKDVGIIPCIFRGIT